MLTELLVNIVGAGLASARNFMSEQILKVDEEHDHLRLDVYLARVLEDAPSRTLIKRFIEAGNVTVNQKQVKAHYKVAAGDEVFVQLSELKAPDDNIEPENIPLDVFYEDENLLVINKPVGMLVHPAGGFYSGTLVNALLYYCQTLSDINSASRPGIVHRLDRETSGLIVVAKDNKTHANLAKQFERHKVKKRYVALVKGEVEFDEGVIDVPLGRHPYHRDKKKVAFDELAKEAKTFYRVIKRFVAEKEKVTMVALFPQSGRTHQLRVHLAYLGHPILGDAKYGDKNSFPRLALHAQSIGFTHPRAVKFIEFFLPLPEEFTNFTKP